MGLVELQEETAQCERCDLVSDIIVQNRHATRQSKGGKKTRLSRKQRRALQSKESHRECKNCDDHKFDQLLPRHKSPKKEYPTVERIDDPASGLYYCLKGDLAGLRTKLGDTKTNVPFRTVVDKFGTNGLMWAAGSGHLDICKWLGNP
jgi:hypothetical protein